MTQENSSIGLVIPTYHACHHLKKTLPTLTAALPKEKILIIDSTSRDGTKELADTYGVKFLEIPQSQFNHGITRELGRKALETDIIVMMTPDAYPTDSQFLQKLIAPLLSDCVGIAYARQIPHEGADFIEAFPREFNYPATSHRRGIEDLKTYGVYSFFCSNSCAAYNNRALDEIGGFPSVLLGEDTVAAAKLLRKGYQIAYVAEATVRHTHRYSLKQEFQRHFDTGYARHLYDYLFQDAGSDAQRGMQYAKKMLLEAWKRCPSLIPYTCLGIAAKWLGYQIGRRSHRAPQWFKRRMSSQKYYWV